MYSVVEAANVKGGGGKQVWGSKADAGVAACTGFALCVLSGMSDFKLTILLKHIHVLEGKA